MSDQSIKTVADDIFLRSAAESAKRQLEINSAKCCCKTADAYQCFAWRHPEAKLEPCECCCHVDQEYDDDGYSYDND